MTQDDTPPARTNWPYGTAIPQRYSSYYKLYQALGGLVDVTADAQAYMGTDPLQDVERFMALNLAFDQIHKEGLAGDFAELGVYKGSTAALLARHARRLGRTLWLLDTFQGFDKRDFTGLDASTRGAFADTSVEAVRNRVGPENTVLIDGYFPETAARLPANRTYCLVHLDADLYAPILSGLEYFYPRMVPGGFMIVHDYGSLAWAGAEKAVDTFFADKPECVINLPDSAGSAMIRRGRAPNSGLTWLAARQVITPGPWYTLAMGQPAYVLAEGWSLPEAWGVWGVGRSHLLRIVLAGQARGGLTLDCDVWAFLPPDTTDRPIDVVVDGRLVTTWHFRPDSNRAVRSVTLPEQTGGHTIEFRPHSIMTPRDADPSNQDDRPLGLALERFRLNANA